MRPLGAACGPVGHGLGQNFHSIAYRLQGGKHLIFISAQLDNAIGAVEIVDPRIIALLHPVAASADVQALRWPLTKADDEAIAAVRLTAGTTPSCVSGNWTIKNRPPPHCTPLCETRQI